MTTSSRPPIPGRAARGRQRGAALLTAMIIVTLVATLAASMVWQQWRAVQVESAERARGASLWILAGALDFGTLILREDQKTNQPTRLTEPWATPLAESRLSTFLSADATPDGDDGPEAFLSGTIYDAQAKYNLMNIVRAADVPARQKEILTLVTLCRAVNVDGNVATTIASRLISAESGDPAVAPLMPRTVQQLTWLGIDEASIRLLEPYVTILPSVSSINPNTASKELLAVVFAIDAGTAEALVQKRQRKPYADGNDVETRGQVKFANATTNVQVGSSDYFEVYGTLRLADHTVTQRSLMQRLPVPPFRRVVWREYAASVERTGG